MKTAETMKFKGVRIIVRSTQEGSRVREVRGFDKAEVEARAAAMYEDMLTSHKPFLSRLGRTRTAGEHAVVVGTLEGIES